MSIINEIYSYFPIIQMILFHMLITGLFHKLITDLYNQLITLKIEEN